MAHEWWTVTDKEGKSKERYLFLFKARILICKVRRISDDRSVFILKDIVRLPEVEVQDIDETRLEINSKTEGNCALVAHKEETKRYWFKEVTQYLADPVALQEHAIDDLKIDPKQHLDTNENQIKLPHRIEAYETNKDIKPSDVAENYTISKYATTRAESEIKTKGQVSSIKESSHVEHKVHVQKDSATVTSFESSEQIIQQEICEVKQEKVSPPKEISKIPVAVPKKEPEVPAPQPIKVKAQEKVEEVTLFKEQFIEKVVEKPKEVEKVVEKVVEKQKSIEKTSIKVEEKKVEESVTQKEAIQIVQQKVEEQIIRRASIEESIKARKASIEESIKVEAQQIQDLQKAYKESVNCEITTVESSVSEKLDQLSQKLRTIRASEVEKDLTKFVKQSTEPTKEELEKQQEIREAIQEKIDEHISESSVIRRIEERYKNKYKNKDINSLLSASPSLERDDEELDANKKSRQERRKSSIIKQTSEVVEKFEVNEIKQEVVEVKNQEFVEVKKQEIIEVKKQEVVEDKKQEVVEDKKERKTSTTKTVEKVEPIKVPELPKKSRKNSKTAVEDIPKSEPKDQEPEITKVADSNKASETPPAKQESTQDNSSSQSNQTNQQSSNNQSSGSTGAGNGNRRNSNDDEDGPPIKLPGFFDPPPPTQYETSFEVHVKKDKPPVLPPIITRKIVVNKDALEKKTADFLKGDIEYESEDFSVATAQKKIRNLKNNIKHTGEQIKFADDTIHKAEVGDFENIKTPGTVVPERRKDPVYEYQYIVEDPVTGLCITSSEPVDTEEAKQDLKKLAKMDADLKTKSSKRVEGNFLSFLQQFFS